MCVCVCVFISISVSMYQASLVPHTVKNTPAMQRPGFDPWIGKIPWRRAWQHNPVSQSEEPDRLQGFVFFFWPFCAECGVLLPQLGCAHCSGSAES